MTCRLRSLLGHLKTGAAAGGAVPADEWELRCELAAAYRIAHEQGWTQAIFNHITVKIPGSQNIKGGPHFLINSFGLRFDEVTASSLLKVTLSGDILEKGTGTGILLDQGFIVHSAVHAARHDLNCIVHCHHQDTVAVAMSKDGILPISQEALGIYSQISYHPFEGTATDPGERDRMATSLGPSNKILVLENHGPLTGGRNLAEAFWYMYLVTRACEYQVRALSIVGGNLNRLHIFEDEKIQEMMERSKGVAGASGKRKGPLYNPVDLQWQAQKRQVEDKFGPDKIYC